MTNQKPLLKSFYFWSIFFYILCFCQAGFAETYKSWTFSSNRENWSSGGNIKPNPTPSYHNADGWPGIIYGDCTGSDPYFVSPSFSLTAKSYHKVVIKIATHGGYKHEMRVYWKRSGDSSYSESRSMASTYYASSGISIKTISIDVGKSSYWSGTIKNIRIDPSRSTCSGTIRYHVDSIKIEGTPTKPPKPSLSSPGSNSSFYKGDSINLRWSNNGYSGTNWLKIYDPSGRSVYDEKFSTRTSKSWQAPTNKTDSFRWELALNSDGMWSSWASRSFYIKDPPKPNLRSPSNGASFDYDSNINFKWDNNGLSGSNWLRIFGPSGLVFQKQFPGGASGFNWDSNNTPTEKYRWQVAFQKNNVWSGWTERSFYINKPQPPPPPGFTSPGNNAKFFCGDTIKFRWNNNGYSGPIWFKIFDPNSKEIEDRKFSSGSTSFNWLSKKDASGTFRWELAIQVNNVWSKWASRPFKVTNPELIVPSTNFYIGDHVSIECNIGKQSAGNNVDFFIDTQGADPVVYLSKSNSNGIASYEFIIKKDCLPEVSFLCRDNVKKTKSNWLKKSINTPSIKISPLSGPQGENFTISGDGISTNQTSKLEIIDPKGKKTSISFPTTNQGAFTTKWMPSQDSPSGYYHCTFIDEQSGFTSKTISLIVWKKDSPSTDETHGILARTIDNPKVYWIKYNKKWHITGSTENPDEPFIGLGFQLSDIEWHASGALDHLSKGKDVLLDNDQFCYRSTDPEQNAVYIIENGESHPFYDWPNFQGQGFTKKDIFWGSPKGIKYIQSHYPVVKAPMIRVMPESLSFKD